MFSWIRVSSLLVPLACLLVLPLQAQSSEQVEVGPPPLHRVAPPPAQASPEELERRGDELRTEKNYLDAVDYYQAALRSLGGNASLINKIGICQLMMQRYKQARKTFERAIHADRDHADAYNNLGVTYYAVHNFNAAIKQYEKAIALKNDAASFYSNMGTAYFGKKEFEKAIRCYESAVGLDPEIFDHSSHAGLQAKLPSPEDRAHYDYVLARLYARTGETDRSLHYLKKAMEEGYTGIKAVYKDTEFATLRKDPRFTELMSAKTLAISD
ncbi:MAG: tetratricopeptide repeat protein [Terriglobales bacterium]|jgi:tetratricopeptide (TPR) repeat protein